MLKFACLSLLAAVALSQGCSSASDGGLKSESTSFALGKHPVLSSKDVVNLPTANSQPSSDVRISYGTPSNASATSETKKLYAWMANLKGRVVFGVSEESDAIYRDFGVRPALLAEEYYDLGPVERKPKLRQDARNQLVEHCSAGGLISLHDHMYNFMGAAQKKYQPKEHLGLRDRTFKPLGQLLPGGRLAEEYRDYLGRMAEFIRDIHVNGKPCPILFRPFHEMNGNWFWWGGEENAENLVKVWRYTYETLVHVEGLNNLLWVWAPSIHRQGGSPPFQQYWPGRQYVDFIGLDGYGNLPGEGMDGVSFHSSYTFIKELAQREGVPFGWSEIGFAESGQNAPGFWYENVLNGMKANFNDAKYFLIWHGKWLPRADSVAGVSARKMLQDSYIITLDKFNNDAVFGKRQ